MRCGTLISTVAFRGLLGPLALCGGKGTALPTDRSARPRNSLLFKTAPCSVNCMAFPGQGDRHGRFKIVKVGRVASRDGMRRLSGVACCRGDATKLRYDMGLPTDPRHSWSFVVVQSAIAVADCGPTSPAAPAIVAGACGDLLKLFSSVSDGRSGQGRDHPVGGAGADRGSGRGGDEGLYGDRWLGPGCPGARAGGSVSAGWCLARRRRRRRRRSGGWSPTPMPRCSTPRVGNWLMSSLLREPGRPGRDRGHRPGRSAGQARMSRRG